MPSTLLVDLDQRKLARLVAAELQPLVDRGLSRQPPLKASTVERKRRAGYSRPSTPLVATGDLERSLRVTATNTGVEVEIDSKARWLGHRLRQILDQREVEAAIDRAINRWLEEVIEVV